MDEIIKDLEVKLKSTMSALSTEAAGVRGNRPSPALVEDLKIEYFGQLLPIKQLGSISVVPPREIAISLWDASNINQVAKAIEDSKRGFTPSVRGGAIYINLPPLSEERREELIKIVKTVIERSKIQIRSLRDEANKKIEAGLKLRVITEDQKTRGKKRIQEAVDKANKETETLLEKKTKEINE